VSTAGRYHPAPNDDAVRCDGQRRPLEELTRAELLLLVEAALPAFWAAAAANTEAQSTSEFSLVISSARCAFTDNFTAHSVDNDGAGCIRECMASCGCRGLFGSGEDAVDASS
jgi:hypothetical protein